MAGVAPLAGPLDTFGGIAGLRAFSPALRRVQWPLKFRLELPLRYDGVVDPAVFLELYAEAIWAADGDDMVMDNWLPMALVGVPCAWLLNLPKSSVASWEELRYLFIAHFAAPVPHAAAAILGGSQAPASDRHVKQLFHQVGSPSHS